MAFGRFQFTAVDGKGDFQAGAQVTVRRETGGAPLALIYSNREGTIPLSNPFSTDVEGFAGFFAANGSYRIDVVKGAYSRTWRYVNLIDDAGGLLTLAGLDSVALKLDGSNYMTSALRGTVGTSTTAADYLRFIPSDWGAGKPYFGIGKDAVADQWNMFLWDGASTDGTLALAVGKTKVAGHVLIEPPIPAADETEATVTFRNYHQRPETNGVDGGTLFGPIPGSVAKSLVLFDSVRTGGEGSYGNVLQFYKVTKAIAEYEFDVGFGSHTAANVLNGGSVIGAWISANSPRAALTGHSIASDPGFAQGISGLEVNAGNRWGNIGFQNYRASGEENYYIVGITSAPDVAVVNNEAAPSYPEELFPGSFAYDITASVFGHKWWIGVVMAPDTLMPGGVGFNMFGATTWSGGSTEPEAWAKVHGWWNKGLDFSNAQFNHGSLRLNTTSDQIMYSAAAGPGGPSLPATAFCFWRVMIGSGVWGAIPIFLAP